MENIKVENDKPVGEILKGKWDIKAILKDADLSTENEGFYTYRFNVDPKMTPEEILDRIINEGTDLPEGAIPTSFTVTVTGTYNQWTPKVGNLEDKFWNPNN